jgi:hypothetical protein
MKNKLIKIAAIALLVAAPTLLTLAQPNPGTNSDGNGVGGGPIGGNAPIGGGLIIMLLSGAAYAGKKAYDAQKHIQE